MNTPITDAAWQDWVENGNAGITLASPMKRLELDRAALMEALRQVMAHDGPGFLAGTCAEIAESALAAARANFPQP